jgi:hypothetical protein
VCRAAILSAPCARLCALVSTVARGRSRSHTVLVPESAVTCDDERQIARQVCQCSGGLFRCGDKRREKDAGISAASG